MVPLQKILLASVAATALFVACATARATPIFEPNNSVFKATVLTPGQMKVTDSLSANSGRPDTLLAAYDPAYKVRGATDDNDSTQGNGKASELLNVPLRPNGSAYFRITGAPDNQFNGLQTESGRYSVRFDLYDKNHTLFQTLPVVFESVAPGMVDNIWIDPDSDPRRVGGSVNVTVNNIVGPGTGDSLDFFLFSGLRPDQPFTAKLDNAGFHALIAQFDSANNLLAESNPIDNLGFFTGKADHQGRAIIGVTGGTDTNFKGEHVDAGQYTVELLSVPEPASVVLFALGAVTLIGLRLRRHR